MAKKTPEGKVKEKLIAFLKSIGCFYYMPVQNGMGQSGIPDIIALIKGEFIAFECKATPKQQPTTLQAMQLDRIDKSGGYAWVVDNENVDLVIKFLAEAIKDDKRLDIYISHSKQTFENLHRWKHKLQVMEFN